MTKINSTHLLLLSAWSLRSSCGLCLFLQVLSSNPVIKQTLFFGEGLIVIIERLGTEQLLLQTQGMDVQTPIPSFKLKRFLTFSQQTPGSILRQSYQNQPCVIPYTRGTHSDFYSICHNCVNPLKQEPEAGQQGDQ